MTEELMWAAPREGQDWRDDHILSAIDWLTSLVPGNAWAPREEAIATRFHAAKQEWAQGRRVPLFDPTDIIGWYIFQARLYASPELRSDWFEPEGFRIAPVFQRLGQLLPTLKAIDGAEHRAASLIAGNVQPDDAIYELLVAGAYRRRGWTDVRFVPEMPGIARTPDLMVHRGRESRAVECKRAGRSEYAQAERQAADRMAAQVHEFSQASGRSIIVLANFDCELSELPDDYLVSKVERFAGGPKRHRWKDEGGQGILGPVDWTPLRSVLQHDDIYFGSSRMAQLLLGGDPSAFDISIMGDWLPAVNRPFHADSVSRVSVVGWISASEEAARRKSAHFRSVIGRAANQLPGDCPGVIHVGYEAIGGNAVDGLRHQRNQAQMQDFDARESRLEWVYGNYWTPEHVTSRDESAAISETTAWYPVGQPTIPEPLPGHLLFIDQDGDAGAHFPR